VYVQELSSRAINNVMAMDADLSVDKIEINPANVAATMAATQPSIHIAPVKKPKPITKPKPHATADWNWNGNWDFPRDVTSGISERD